MIRFLALSLACLLPLAAAEARETIRLKAADGVAVTADVYRTQSDKAAPWIVLAHQAGSSRGEYRDIAPRLNALGFNAVALDQRSGDEFGGVRNETAAAAARGGDLPYHAAKPDILAGIAWARAETTGPVILWGSSYSAALALLIAGETPGLVDGVVAMSPGEYIRGQSIGGAAQKITAPAFVASGANEVPQWETMFAAIPHEKKARFAPKSGGRHGSSALIAKLNSSAEAYWGAVEAFLVKFFR